MVCGRADVGGRTTARESISERTDKIVWCSVVRSGCFLLVIVAVVLGSSNEVLEARWKRTTTSVWKGMRVEAIKSNECQRWARGEAVVVVVVVEVKVKVVLLGPGSRKRMNRRENGAGVKRQPCRNFGGTTAGLFLPNNAVLLEPWAVNFCFQVHYAFRASAGTLESLPTPARFSVFSKPAPSRRLHGARS
jgi:hypothetical protein